MEIIVDTNILISALVKPAKSRELMCSLKLILYSPEHIISESIAHKDEILSKSGVSEDNFLELVKFLISKINLVPEEEFKACLKPALKLVTHPEDAPFMALALSKNIPVWSDDRDFKRQSLIKIFDTKELVALLNL